MESIRKKKWFLLALIVLLAVVLMTFLLQKDDGMKQNPEVSVMYRVKINGKWDKWYKNGTSNSKINSNNYISDMQIVFAEKFKKRNVVYKIYANNKWSSNLYDTSSLDIKKINALSVPNRRKYLIPYDICYRSYNKKNGWLEWACNGEISGNKNEAINSIQLKIIPQNIIKNEYLKDFGLKNKKNIGF